MYSHKAWLKIQWRFILLQPCPQRPGVAADFHSTQAGVTPVSACLTSWSWAPINHHFGWNESLQPRLASADKVEEPYKIDLMNHLIKIDFINCQEICSRWKQPRVITGVHQSEPDVKRRLFFCVPACFYHVYLSALHHQSRTLHPSYWLVLLSTIATLRLWDFNQTAVAVATAGLKDRVGRSNTTALKSWTFRLQCGISCCWLPRYLFSLKASIHWVYFLLTVRKSRWF